MESVVKSRNCDTRRKGETTMTEKDNRAAALRNDLKNKKRIIVKAGSATLTHPETNRLDLIKIEVLIRELADLRNRGKDVIFVTSASITAGRAALGLDHRPVTIAEKQACSAVGMARLMMIYQRFFAEYGQTSAQILLTKSVALNEKSRENARNTFNALLEMNTIPIVNENDTIATSEIEELDVFGDNDRLAAMIGRLTDSDLIILLSDIDGLYTDDPRKNSDAEFIPYVHRIDEHFLAMGKDTDSAAGSGGMTTKLLAAKLAVSAGCDMVIANGDDFRNIHKIINGEDIGTLFRGEKDNSVDIESLIE